MKKNTGHAFSWSFTASCFIFEQTFTKALSFSFPPFCLNVLTTTDLAVHQTLAAVIFQPGSAYFPFFSEPLPLVFFLGFLEGGGSAGPVLADCSDSSACDCDAWDCLLLTFSISASSF